MTGPADGELSRRRFLAGLAAAGATGVGAALTLGRDPGPAPAPDAAAPAASPGPAAAAPPTTGPPPPTAPLQAVDALPGVLTAAPVDQRILVLVELEGGNDGASTVIPAGTGAYYDARPDLALAPDSVLALDDSVGLNPNLARLFRRQLAVVEGVGPVDGTLSHFEMSARWESGDVDGRSRPRSGFLARLIDALDTGTGTVGLSVAGFTPRFADARASTLSIDRLDQLRLLTEDEWIYPSYRRALAGFGGGPLATRVATSWAQLADIGQRLPGGFDEIDSSLPMVAEGGQLGAGLAAAAQLLRADLGIRVVHARLGGFDTHDGHAWRHPRLMAELDAAVDGFLALMDEAGMADRVLVATTSEFGRRLGQNGSGLDHGVASTMLLVGPVRPGRHGEAPSLTNLDRDGNPKTTVPFDVYLGSLAESWLGVDAAAVLPTAPEVFPLAV